MSKQSLAFPNFSREGRRLPSHPSFVHTKAGPSHGSLQRLPATFLATYQTPDGTKTVRAKTVAVPGVVPAGVPYPLSRLRLCFIDLFLP